jgi:hypothetical protein
VATVRKGSRRFAVLPRQPDARFDGRIVGRGHFLVRTVRDYGALFVTSQTGSGAGVPLWDG